MPFITVGKENLEDIQIYYEDHGAGKPVLLIHGWPLSSSSWEKQVAALAEAGYRVITYDRRGFGKSSQPISGYDYDTLASDLHLLIMKLDLRDIALFGFSMGGGEVARYIGTHGSERVKKAGFISAVTPFLLKTADNPDGIDSKLFDNLQKSCRDDRFAFIQGFLQLFYNVKELQGKLISDAAVQASFQVAVQASAKATHDCIGAWLTDFREDLKQFDIPTLVIHGAADQTAPFSATGEKMPNYLKQVKLVVIEDGPHGLNWTHAEKLNQELLDFLS